MSMSYSLHLTYMGTSLVMPVSPSAYHTLMQKVTFVTLALKIKVRHARDHTGTTPPLHRHASFLPNCFKLLSGKPELHQYSAKGYVLRCECEKHTGHMQLVTDGKVSSALMQWVLLYHKQCFLPISGIGEQAACAEWWRWHQTRSSQASTSS